MPISWFVVSGGVKVLADVARANRAEKRVRDCMRQHIGVGMSFQSEQVGNFNSAQDKFPILAEAMNVVANSAARCAHSCKSMTPFEATILYLSFISSRGRKSTLPPAVST